MKKQKRTIIKKKPTVNNLEKTLTPRRGRPPKAKKQEIVAEIKEQETVEQKEITTNEKINNLIEAVNNQDNITMFTDLLNAKLKNTDNEVLQLKKELNKQNEENLSLQQQLKIAQEKIKLLNKKHRTIYMQLQHERRQYQIGHNRDLNTISALKMLLVGTASDEDLHNTIDKITEVCNPNHVATKKKIKLDNIVEEITQVEQD